MRDRDNGFARAQRAYEAMTPPEWEGDDACEDGDCGECETCRAEARQSYLEDQADAKWEEARERRSGL